MHPSSAHPRGGRLLAPWFGLLLAMAPLGALAAPAVSVLPSAFALAPGGSVELTLVANDELPPLSCFAITLDMDGAVVDLVDAGEGLLFSSALDPTFFQREQDELGRDRLSGCVLGFGTSVAAPGELARFTLQAQGAGITSVQIVEAVLRDVDRAEIAGVQLVDGSVSVGATATPPRLDAMGGLRASPNPSSGNVRLRLELGDPVTGSLLRGAAAREILGVRELRIYDLAGRLVRHLHWRTGELIWDGRSDTGLPVASGAYLAVARGDGPRLVTKLLRVD